MKILATFAADDEVRRTLGKTLHEITQLGDNDKRLLTLEQMRFILGIQLRLCQGDQRLSYECVLLEQLTALMDGNPDLTREEVQRAYQHLRRTPGLPPMLSDGAVLTTLQVWLSGCKQAPAAGGRHLRLVE